MNFSDLLAQGNYGQMQQSTAMLLVSLAVVVYVFFCFCIMKVANKTGTDNSWMAYIPILQVALLLRIGDKPVWYLVMAFIPFLNIVFAVMIWVWVAEALGRSTLWAALAALSSVGLLILLPSYAFSD